MGLRVSATAASRCSDDGRSVEMAKPDMGRWQGPISAVPGALGTFSGNLGDQAMLGFTSPQPLIYFLVRHYGF